MPKKTKKSKESKSIEVKVNVPITGVSLTSLLLVSLLALIGYSGYLGVKSIWNFTHPKFSVSLDTFRALGYIATNKPVPPFAFPAFTGSNAPDTTAQSEYLQAMRDFKKTFLETHSNSPLAQISDNELLSVGWSFCQAKKKSIDATGKFSAADIISSHQAKYVLRYPNIKGLGEFLSGLGDQAFNHLCKEN